MCWGGGAGSLDRTLTYSVRPPWGSPASASGRALPRGGLPRASRRTGAHESGSPQWPDISGPHCKPSLRTPRECRTLSPQHGAPSARRHGSRGPECPAASWGPGIRREARKVREALLWQTPSQGTRPGTRAALPPARTVAVLGPRGEGPGAGLVRAGRTFFIFCGRSCYQSGRYVHSSVC